MINLRYHIVSLAAAFLAFGLGILAGTTVIDTQIVNSLRGNTSALEKNLNDVRANLADVQKQLKLWEQFGREITPPLMQGKLAGRSVVLVNDAKTPDALLSELDDAFRFAGAARATRLTLTDKWTLDGSASVELLRRALSISATAGDAVEQEAGSRLGARLAGSGDASADGDAVKALSDAGFLDVRGLPDTGTFPPANTFIVVVSSGDPQEAPALEGFFIPLLKALSSTRVVAVAEPTTADQSLAQIVRGDRSLSREVCTIDHLDTVAGQLSLVYGLRDLGAGKTAEHFGVRGGASAVAPDLRTS